MEIRQFRSGAGYPRLRSDIERHKRGGFHSSDPVVFWQLGSYTDYDVRVDEVVQVSAAALAWQEGRQNCDLPYALLQKKEEILRQGERWFTQNMGRELTPQQVGMLTNGSAILLYRDRLAECGSPLVISRAEYDQWSTTPAARSPWWNETRDRV
jgi:hypothetical protein